MTVSPIPMLFLDHRFPYFTGTTSGFEQKSSNVSFLGGNENVSFRFTFLSDVAVTDTGLALDDFELLGPEEGECSSCLLFTTGGRFPRL